MECQPLALPEVVLIQPRVFEDARGWFYESFNADRFAALVGVQSTFVQDNHSRSANGVLRGLHYQLAPHAQGKLVRVLRGAIFDVAVDIRRTSTRFGKWAGVELSESNRHQLWIPPGFAHGFVALSEGTEVLYKTTDFWHPASERSIRWDDPSIGIHWPMQGAPILNGKDLAAPLLSEAELPEH
ncbi:MAG: dTDP-4-dehydrorhamnose 3,5-epimerase [Phycisphaerales bacterium]